LAGAIVALGEASPGLAAFSSDKAPSWVDRPMRWAQLTLVEDDPGKFDVSFWLDYFRRTHSDAVCLSPSTSSDRQPLLSLRRVVRRSVYAGAFPHHPNQSGGFIVS